MFYKTKAWLRANAFVWRPARRKDPPLVLYNEAPRGLRFGLVPNPGGRGDPHPSYKTKARLRTRALPCRFACAAYPGPHFRFMKRTCGWGPTPLLGALVSEPMPHPSYTTTAPRGLRVRLGVSTLAGEPAPPPALYNESVVMEPRFGVAPDPPP